MRTLIGALSALLLVLMPHSAFAATSAGEVHFARTGLALVATCAVAVIALRWWASRSPPATGALRIDSRVALGRATSVVVVTVDDRRLLLGVGPTAVTTLAELERASVHRPANEHVSRETLPSKRPDL